jgi:hypothetical protein
MLYTYFFDNISKNVLMLQDFGGDNIQLNTNFTSRKLS